MDNKENLADCYFLGENRYVVSDNTCFYIIVIDCSDQPNKMAVFVCFTSWNNNKKPSKNKIAKGSRKFG